MKIKKIGMNGTIGYLDFPTKKKLAIHSPFILHLCRYELTNMSKFMYKM